VLYGLKVLRRDYLPPTPARNKRLLYRLFGHVVTFSTIIVVVATALWARALHRAGHTQVRVVGDIQEGWNPLRGVALGEFGASEAFAAAVPLALIGFLEAYAMARKYALVHKYDIDINQEASALGLANILSCAFSIFPATGNFGRTALANDVGVRTQTANLVVGLCITVVITRLTQLLYYIPRVGGGWMCVLYSTRMRQSEGSMCFACVVRVFLLSP
jgi:MFS superfamily sulfate permease-like transporter